MNSWSVIDEKSIINRTAPPIIVNDDTKLIKEKA